MAKKTVYEWKNGHAWKVDAQTAGEHLEVLRQKKDGTLTSEVVLEDARSRRSPLHKCFEWDDAVAAEKYRLDQAGDLLRSIVVTFKSADRTEKSTRAFVHVETQHGRGYTSLAHAMSDADLRKQVIQRAWVELQGWRERYREYEELATIFGAMDKAEKKIVA